jgi:hypothetical protein
MITMRRSKSAVSKGLNWLAICGFTALIVVAAEAEDAFRLQDVGIPSASDYQGIALGDATDEIYLYLSRDKHQGQLYRWQGHRAVMVDLVDLENPGSEAGAGWADYGSDGDLDLFVSRVGLPDLLYLNDDGVFSERANSLGVDDSGSGQGVSWVDYDQDGSVDLYVARFGQPNLLYAGQAGNDPFVEKGAEVGLADPGPSTGGAWGDFDADGDLDLYVVNHKRADHLYRHIDGHLFERSDLAEDDGAGVGATWVDWDNDGDLDLSLARYGEPDRLLRNEGSEGNFRFTDIAPEVRLDDRGQGQMVAWGDYDLDGDPDAYVVNGGEARDVSRLYHNDHGSFSDASIETGLTDPTKGAARIGKAAIWWDHDGDGDLDLLTIARGEGSGLFENDGLSGKNGWLKVRVRNQDLGDLNWFPGSVIVHSAMRHTSLLMNAHSSYLNQGSQLAVVGLGRDGVDSVEVIRIAEDPYVDYARSKDSFEISRRVVDPSAFHSPVTQIGILPEEVVFGPVSRGLSESRYLYIANNGQTAMRIDTVAFLPPGPKFVMNEPKWPINIFPGERDSLLVVFHCERARTDTTALELRANVPFPRVLLVGRGVGTGEVRVLPSSIRMSPGGREAFQIENLWTAAVSRVNVSVPGREDISVEWNEDVVLEPGERMNLFLSVDEGTPSTRVPVPLVVRYRLPNDKPLHNQARVVVKDPDLDGATGGWSRGETYSVYGVIGVFLTFIAHMIATNI